MEKIKYEKYKVLIPAADQSTKLCVFKAPVMEAHGRWSEDMRFVFKVLLNDVCEKHHDIPRSVHAAFWKSSICFAMHKTAAAGFQAKYERPVN
jgi:hypothetical protein